MGGRAGGDLSTNPNDPAARIEKLERELARAAERAEAADRRARILYDGASDPMFEVDGAGVLRGANAAAVQRFGAAVVGKDLSELFRPGDAELVERMFAGAMETSLDRELQLLAGGAVSIRGIAPSASGRIVVVLRVEAKAPSVSMSDEHRRQASVGRLAALLAHEMNNPLTVLQLRADLLREDGPPPRLIEQLDLLHDAVGRVGRSVKTFQRVARPHRPSRDAVSVAEVVDRALSGCRSASRVQLEPVPMGFEVRGDEDALALAIEQILTVALDAGPVKVRVEGFDQQVRIEVVSEGALWTGSSRDTPADRTQELALSIASIVVRDHGGEIRTSEREKGGVLRVELPRHVDGGAERGRGVRVLVVDDEPMVAAVLADWCLRKGHLCRVASSAEEAMSVLAEEVRYDAVLVDDRLPGASGLQLLSWIGRERPSLLDRSALMSGAAPTQPVPYAFLAKPFTRRQLAEVVEALLAR